ncbi:MAG TPA: serine/threonine-protein kinase, partial [Minicystis sp.]|nr:serine/threonine-protein kinase [Minicystis sp.]
MKQDEAKEGATLDGRYALGRELGRGGHGVVFAATDTQTGEAVAVKVLKQNIAEDPQYAVRLWREAQSLRALWGSSVVRVHRFGHAEGGDVYMVMELLEGDTLDHHLVDIEGFGDKMSAFDVLTCLDPVARALHTAHSKGIIHRDVKPANIFLVAPESGGGVRLMDFGLAKIAGAEALTQVGMIAGSPAYIAPEVWRAAQFDHRIDVYSLGAVVFRCLAGKTPFSAPTHLELFMKVTTAERPRLSEHRPELGPEIDAWVKQALAIKPEDRFPYVSTMWNELLKVVMSGTSP